MKNSVWLGLVVLAQVSWEVAVPEDFHGGSLQGRSVLELVRGLGFSHRAPAPPPVCLSVLWTWSLASLPSGQVIQEGQRARQELPSS